jgi:hypothetical protein
MRIPKIAALVILVLLGRPAQAQRYTNSYGYTFNNPVSATCNAMFWNQMNARLLYRTMLEKRGYSEAQLAKMSAEQMRAALGGEAKPPQASAAVRAGNATRFRPQRRRLLLPELARSLVRDPAQQRALLALFEEGIKGYERDAQRSGLVHDLAGAITFFIGASLLVYRQGEVPDEQGLEHLARAVRQNLDTPPLKQVADADKQKFYELMIGLGTYLGVAYQQAVKENNAAQAKKLREVAAAALRGYLKLDPARLRVTRTGLEIAGP